MEKKLFTRLFCTHIFMLCMFSLCAQNNNVSSNSEYEAFTPAGGPTVLLPRTSILPEQIAIIVNDADPISASVASYYASARGIPTQNIITVSLNTSSTASLSTSAFNDAMDDINAALLGRENEIQAFVLAWKAPNFFDGIPRQGFPDKSSVCAAFANGELLSNPGGESYTHDLENEFYNSNSVQPYTDYGIRPTMHLMTNANTLAEAEDLIDLGVSADGTFPTGDGYFVRTRDPHRNARWSQMLTVPSQYSGIDLYTLDLSGVTNDYLSNTSDILFYFTGNEWIDDIETNSYAPGAICDHLTSGGGRIGGGQMFIGEWLEAGATATYGTVSEPTSSPSRFPNVSHLVREYFQGGSAIDSYWKSVLNPSLGMFAGEPLARPYKPQVTYESNTLAIKTSLFDIDAYYLLEEAGSALGPWISVQSPMTFQEYSVQNLIVQNADPSKFYRIIPDYIPPSPPNNFVINYKPDSIMLPCSLSVPHCEVRFDVFDSTGEVAGYKVYIDGQLFETIYDSEPLVRIGYNPKLAYRRQASRLEIRAIDVNGNESALSQTQFIDIPEYHEFGHKTKSGRIITSCSSIGDIEVKKGQADLQTAQGSELSYGMDLQQNHPNPFKNGTIIGFSIPEDGRVRFEIHDLSGRYVWSVENSLEAGVHTLAWNGENQEGKRITPGIYLCTMRFEEEVRHIRMMIE